MQKQEEFLKNKAKEAKIKRNRTIAELHKKLKEKGTEETRLRGRRMACALAAFLLSYVLSGREMMLGTYPLAIAFICGIGEYYLAAFAGALVGGLVNEVAREYIFAAVAVFLIRLFMSLPFMPKIFLQRSSLSDEPFSDARGASGELGGARGGVFYKARVLAYRLFHIRENESRVSLSAFFERVGTRLVISAAGGFIGGLFLLIQNDFSYYSLAALLFLMLACPIFSWLFSGIFDRDVSLGGLFGTVSAAFSMLICVYAARSVTVFALALSPMLAMLFTLIATRSRGVASGLLMAFLSAVCFDIRFAPMLMLSCVAYALLHEIRVSAAMATVVGVCLIWSYYFCDIDSFVRILPPTLIALPVFLIFDKYMKGAEERRERIFEENKYFAKSVSEESKNQAVRARVSSLSEAFSSLSQAVSSLSDKFSRPDTLGIRAITDGGFLQVCEGCPNHDVCFGAEYNRTVETSGRITSALHKRGCVEESDLGEEFSSICVRRKKLVDKMNSLCAERTESIIRGQRTSPFATSYEDIKDILQDAISAGGDEYECDTATGGRIYEYLRGEGYDVDGVVVCGKRCRRVMVKGVSFPCGAHDENAMALCKKISDIVGTRMVGPVFEVGDDGMLMLFSAKPKLKAVCSSGRRAVFENKACESGELSDEVDPFGESADEKRDELCGDATNAFLTDTSYFYSLISDGMGSGSDAAFSAGICSMFCEKMLMAGNRADITIRMLNNFLRGENSRRGTECSVTVDLFELDLMLGIASFIKSGAAPTYVLRGGEVYKIASKTMPVGIIKNPDIKVTRFDMRSGDIVLMMSDGICGEEDECEWIVEAISEAKLPSAEGLSISDGEKHISELRDRIFDIAREKMQNADRFDDASLSVVLVI